MFGIILLCVVAAIVLFALALILITVLIAAVVGLIGLIEAKIYKKPAVSIYKKLSGRNINKRNSILEDIFDLFSNPKVKVGFYVCLIVLAILLRFVNENFVSWMGGDEEALNQFQKLLKTTIGYFADAVTVSTGVGLILDFGKSILDHYRRRKKEEVRKEEANHHKIVRQYVAFDKDKKDLAVKEKDDGRHYTCNINFNIKENYYSKAGDVMQIHHLYFDNTDNISFDNEDIYSDDFLKERRAYQAFIIAKKHYEDPSGFKQNGYLNIANLNVYTNFTKKVPIEIESDELKYKKLSPYIEANRTTLLGAHEGEKKNNLTLGLSSFKVDKDNKVQLGLTMTSYYDMLITNRAMDYSINNTSLRDTLEFSDKLTPLEKSVFSNQIGITGVILSKDGYVLIEDRGYDKVIWRNKFGPSISFGSKDIFDPNIVKVDTPLERGNNLKAKIRKAMIDSIRKNYGFIEGIDYKAEAIDFDNAFMGMARDLLEGGKPNFYFYVELDINADEATKRMELYASLGEVNNDVPPKAYNPNRDKNNFRLMYNDSLFEGTNLNKEEMYDNIKNKSNLYRPIGGDKLKSPYYFVKHDAIRIDYYYNLILEDQAEGEETNFFKVERKLYPRFEKGLKNIKDKKVKFPIKSTAEGLLVCLSYLEMLQDYGTFSEDNVGFKKYHNGFHNPSKVK